MLEKKQFTEKVRDYFNQFFFFFLNLPSNFIIFSTSSLYTLITKT